ncbi:hypothetical protein E2C01_087889 [Portunus trituberculatus]|uniref:Uncharacterized protein n=1 Tax=Portunus trituberculatus TaxID=210409 RepID=A0A5B7J9B7_PORTR|nr:hypothetical protein [Portunus trituberculatus]
MHVHTSGVALLQAVNTTAGGESRPATRLAMSRPGTSSQGREGAAIIPMPKDATMGRARAPKGTQKSSSSSNTGRRRARIHDTIRSSPG